VDSCVTTFGLHEEPFQNHLISSNYDGENLTNTSQAVSIGFTLVEIITKQVPPITHREDPISNLSTIAEVE
jgi:hypothetical protein